MGKQDFLTPNNNKRYTVNHNIKILQQAAKTFMIGVPKTNVNQVIRRKSTNNETLKKFKAAGIMVKRINVK